MARSKTSARWLKEHFDDPYVKLAKQEGYRSRASFKLIEIDDKHRLLRPGMSVIDLGAAPGGWSQVASKRIGSKGSIVAVDILPMDSMADVDVIQGDFTDDAVFDQIMDVIGDKKVDLVLSDMAPNISGMSEIDQPRAMYLIELALDLAVKSLRPGGSLLVKAFHGEGFDDWLRECKTHFKKVQSIKPKASRPRSKEIYQLAQQLKSP
ncbi:MAG: 23S rRNA (uridine(2552)-2'-O)-methyltransferase RlmE [Pseudomonadales bacterium]